MKSWYDVNGLRLVVEAEASDLMAAIVPHLAPFATEACSADWAISIERGAVGDVPDTAESVHEGEALPGIASRLALSGERSWFVIPGRFCVHANRAGKTASICLSVDCDRSLRGLAGLYALDQALAASGQYLVHGAALAMPGTPSRALLIFAPSGVGKTTTALALALGGFQLITDDAIVLQPRGYRGQESARAWGLPRPLKVHRRTAELLPALAPLLQGNWDSAGEQPLHTAALGAIAAVATPKPVPVAAVAVLAERSGAGHHFVPVPKAQALLRVAQDNVATAHDGVPSAHQERFNVLGGLLASIPTFDLRVGAPLATLSDHVAKSLLR
jgi:hypothetical protein